MQQPVCQPIPAILMLPPQAPVSGVRGRIVNLYPPKVGTTKTGRAYSLQNLLIEDGTGNKLKLTLSERTLGSDQEGNFLTVTAHQSNEGLRGLTVDEYNGKKGLMVEKTAGLTIEPAGPPPAQTYPDPAWVQETPLVSHPPAAALPTAQQPQAPAPLDPNPVLLAALQQYMTATIQSFRMAFDAAGYIERLTGHKIDAEAIQKIAVGAVIYLDRLTIIKTLR